MGRLRYNIYPEIPEPDANLLFKYAGYKVKKKKCELHCCSERDETDSRCQNSCISDTEPPKPKTELRGILKYKTEWDRDVDLESDRFSERPVGAQRRVCWKKSPFAQAQTFPVRVFHNPQFRRSAKYLRRAAIEAELATKASRSRAAHPTKATPSKTANCLETTPSYGDAKKKKKDAKNRHITRKGSY